MSEKIDQLTFTRFLSAFGILLPHFSEGTVFEFPEFKSFLLPFFGVSYFFILSGFVLGISYYHKMPEGFSAFNKKDYFLRRFARIYPVYILAFVLELFFAVYFGGKAVSVSVILQNVFLLQGWFLDGFINFPSWSLSCEMFFYASLPWLLFRMKAMSNKQLLGFTALIWIVQQFVFYYLFVIQNDFPFNLRFHPLIHFPTFITGIVLAIFFHRKNEWFKQWIMPYSNYLIIFLIGIIIFNKSVFHYETTQTPFYLAFIFIVALPGNFFEKHLSTKIFINLGYISYAIYILQVPISRYFSVFYSHLGRVNPNVQYVMLIPLIILVSAGVYFFYEKPLYRLLTQKPAR